MGYIDIIAIVIFAGFMPVKFISDYHRIFKPWKEQKINQVKEWNRQRNNRTRELKKQIKEWNNRRNNKTRELIKKIKDWNNQRNQKLRAWKERRRVNLENFKAWWNKDVLPEWEKATSFKKIYIVFSCIIGVILAILFLALCLQIILTLFGLSNIDEIDSNFALAFLGTISGGVALFTGYIAILRSETNTRQNEIANDQSKTADKQAITAEQGLITDRINKAVEGLGKSDKDGKPVMQVRHGALYALERIAQDSERDHIKIMELLCAYIRTNSSNNNEEIITNPLREDIHEALNIIGGRNKSPQGKNRLKIEQIQGMRLNFYNCYLESAELYGANLSDANFYKANLQNAWLTNADISRARLIDANISGAKFKNTKTSGAYAWTGDFSGCKTLNQEQINQMFLGKGVVLPEGLIHPQKEPKYDKKYSNEDDFMEAYEEWMKTL